MYHHHVHWISVALLGISLLFVGWAAFLLGTQAISPTIAPIITVSPVVLSSIMFFLLSLGTNIIATVLKRHENTIATLHTRIESLEALVLAPTSVPAPSPTEVRPSP
jgi:hypothetical protein